MSHYRLKSKYNTEGAYGSIEEQNVYAHHNLSCDYVTFYDDDGSVIMTIPDTIDGNLLETINKLFAPFEENNELSKGIESMTIEDIKKCNL